ncbi:MAG TPA: TonB-dependent receptor [Croceibacterium sp.]
MKLKYLLAASAISLSAAVVLPAPLAAQQITTGIEGTVTDEAGAPIAGAMVTITDERTGASRTITANDNGNFTASGLVSGGPYTVSATAADYEGQTVSDIQTTLQGNTSLTFALTSGGGVITVTASRVRATQLEVGPGTSFTAEVLEAAPTFNRDIRDIIRLDPRVSLDRDDGGSGVDRISCLGGNDRGNAFTVDGISQGDIYGLNDTGFSSRSSTPVPYDAVRETQVQFAPFDVEYGNFTGCAISVITKSGSNQFHGGAFFEYGDDGMRGNVAGGKAAGAIDEDIRYGVNFGGPIIRDRLFFFGAYEYQEAAAAQEVGPTGAGYPNEIAGVTEAQFDEISQVLSDVYGIETGPLVTSLPFKNERFFGRLDWQITDDHRAELTYQRLEESSTRADDFATSSFPNQVTGLNTFYLSGTESNYYSGRIYSNWTDEFSTELRYSRSEVTDLQNPVGGGEAQDANPIPRILVGVDNATDGAVLAGPGFSRSANALDTLIQQFYAVGRYETGDHSIKVGGEINKAHVANLFVQDATGTLSFRNVNDLRQGLLSPGSDTFQTESNLVNGVAAGAVVNATPTGDIATATADVKRTIYSLFVQDDWQATDQLQLVLGARAEFYSGNAPTANPNFLARYDFSNDTGFDALNPVILPRLGFTYDFDDFAVFGAPQFRGGAGLFSGGDPLVWFGNAFQNNGQLFGQGNSRSTGCPAGQIDVVVNGEFTGVPACAVAAASAQGAAGLGDTQAIDPDIKVPTVARLNLGFQSGLDFAQSGLFSGWNLNLDYIYSHYRNPYTVSDLSQVPDPARGLNGFTIDGRPILRAIDPTRTNCNAVFEGADPRPTYSNVTAACFGTSRDDEIFLTNAGGYDSHIASVILSKQFDGLFTDGGSGFFSMGYSYTDSQDRRNMYNSTAGSNYDNAAYFDQQDPPATRGFFGSKHNITVSGSLGEQFFGDNDTRLSFTFVARSGRPYSLTFGGSGIFADSASGSNNALLYIPTGINDPNIAPVGTGAGRSNQAAVENLVALANSLSCARDYIGQTIERNTCSNDWYYDLDLSLSQELPGPGSFFGVDDKIKLFAMFDNFLNFLDSDWNVQRRRQFAGLQDVASLASGNNGVDSQGRYVITGFNAPVNGVPDFENDNFVNMSSSLWRLKIGISYAF